MKNVRVTVLLNALTLLAVGLMVYAPPAFAALNCFSDTNDHWAETFICWLKDNGISSGYPDGSYKPDQTITRGEMAVMLQRQAEVPPSSGTIFITTGSGSWLPSNETGTLLGIQRFANATIINKSSTGVGEYFFAQPSLPTALYGRSLQLLGAEFCYSAQAAVYITSLSLTVQTTINSGIGVATVSYQDNTDRTDTACRYYALPSPTTLNRTDSVVFAAIPHWATANSSISLGRVTFVLQPTGTSAVLPKELTENSVILTEGTAPELPLLTAP